VTVRLHVRVRPGARRTGFVGWYGEIPKLAVAAPAVDGAANEAVVVALAELLGLRPRQVHLVGGIASRSKRFDLDGITADEVAARLRALDPALR
jgi:uncharacterized protein YggU (UPF0235/DUF167 family)